MREAEKFKKEKEKILLSQKLFLQDIEETITLLEADPADHRLRPHKINCKHDKNRRSVSIKNTGYRILYTTVQSEIVLVRIVPHDIYDRLNKDC